MVCYSKASFVELTFTSNYFFSVPIDFLSKQRLKGQDHFNMEGHVLPHPSLQLLSSVVRNPIAILFAHSSE